MSAPRSSMTACSSSGGTKGRRQSGAGPARAPPPAAAPAQRDAPSTDQTVPFLEWATADLTPLLIGLKVFDCGTDPDVPGVDADGLPLAYIVPFLPCTSLPAATLKAQGRFVASIVHRLVTAPTTSSAPTDLSYFDLCAEVVAITDRADDPPTAPEERTMTRTAATLVFGLSKDGPAWDVIAPAVLTVPNGKGGLRYTLKAVLQLCLADHGCLSHVLDLMDRRDAIKERTADRLVSRRDTYERLLAERGLADHPLFAPRLIDTVRLWLAGRTAVREPRLVEVLERVRVALALVRAPALAAAATVPAGVLSAVHMGMRGLDHPQGSTNKAKVYGRAINKVLLGK